MLREIFQVCKCIKKYRKILTIPFYTSLKSSMCKLVNYHKISNVSLYKISTLIFQSCQRCATFFYYENKLHCRSFNISLRMAYFPIFVQIKGGNEYYAKMQILRKMQCTDLKLLQLKCSAI